MKILFLCSDLGIPVLGRKGAAVHVRALVAALARAGHHVVLASPLLNKSPWEQPAVMEGHLLHFQGPLHITAAVAALRQFNATLGVENSLPGELRRILCNQELAQDLKHRFESDPPDFIYERATLYGTAGALLARELNVPLLIELNAPLTVEQERYRGSCFADLAAQAEQWLLARADAVLPVSAPLRHHVISLGVDPERVHVVPNGVDPLLFQPGRPEPSVRARLRLDEGPVLGFIGSLRPCHGVEVLPELLERLVKRYKTVQLLVVGDGPLRPQLEASLARKGLARRVVFTGTLPHEEVPAVIRQFDVALAPYPRLDHLFYFSPLKLFEYMACGAAVVAAAVGQVCDVVTDGQSGLLYPAGDVESLAAACARLLADPPLRRALGRAAAKRIHTHYTWDRNACRALELARALIAARNGANRNPTAP